MELFIYNKNYESVSLKVYKHIEIHFIYVYKIQYICRYIITYTFYIHI